MAAAQDARRTLRRARAAPGVSFGYLFRWAEDARDDPDADARLAALAAAMSEDECDPGRAASGLPLIVPLFGQFLEHDLAAAADVRTTSGRSPETGPLRPRARAEVERSLVNLRDGTLDLDSLYGVDAGEGPLAARIARLMREPGAEARLRLDLPAPSTLGRPEKPADRGRTPPEALFDAARREVRRHVQWLALNRWLPRLCDPAVLARVRRAGAPFYTEMRNGVRVAGQRRQPAPLEWWAAAARFRLPMIPADLPLNRFHPRAGLGLQHRSTGAGLSGGRLPADRVADWSLLAAEPAPGGPRGARAIGTHIAPDERHAPVFRDLALAILRKGHALNLPPAQACAAELNMVYVDLVRPLSRQGLLGGHTGEAVRDGFEERTPLWFYILREAEVQREGQGLGQLGSAILAEAIIGMIAADPDSIWRRRGRCGLPWSPEDGIRPGGRVVDGFEALLEAAELL